MRSHKILALCVMFSFVVSIVPAFAEEGSSDTSTSGSNIETSSGEIVKPLSIAGTFDTTRLTEEQKAELEVKIAVARERYEAAKSQLDAARERYNAAKLEWERVKTTFNTARDKLTVGKALDYLKHGRTRVIDYLDALKEKIDAVEGWDDAKKTALKTEVDGYIATLQAAKAKLDSIDLNVTEDSDKTAIRDAAKELKTTWGGIQPQLKRIVGEILAQRMQNAIDKGNTITANIDAKIANLTAAGENTTQLVRVNTKFKENLASAQGHLNEALTDLGEVKAGTDVRANLESAQKHLKLAAHDLNDMHAFAKRLANKLRQAERTGEVEHEPEDEEEPEVESEHVSDSVSLEEHD